MNDEESKLRETPETPRSIQDELFPYEVIFDSPDSVTEYMSNMTASNGLDFACLLIPRFPSHTLAGDLSVMLPDWLGQVCASRGWQLGFVNVDQEFLQWGLRIPSADGSADFINKIRREVSAKIFSEFPRFRQQNFGPDFWAPGHLVMLGNAPHSRDLIQGIMKMVRRNQGLI